VNGVMRAAVALPFSSRSQAAGIDAPPVANDEHHGPAMFRHLPMNRRDKQFFVSVEF